MQAWKVKSADTREGMERDEVFRAVGGALTEEFRDAKYYWAETTLPRRDHSAVSLWRVGTKIIARRQKHIEMWNLV